MVVIKLTTPWQQDYYKQTDSHKGVFGDYIFEIDNDCDTCDYWIIWGGLLKEEKVWVKSHKVIYVTDEAHDQRKFNDTYLRQFSIVASLRKDLKINNIIPIHEFSPWYFNKTYDFLVPMPPPEKTKKIAVISSNLTWLPGHKKRFDFVNKLTVHFKDKIDHYGRGFNEVSDKYDALIDYKYSIAIENNSIPDYFTEKISECFLTYTMPVYYGCPNIDTYYDKRSLLYIDINDYDSAIKKIEELLETDPYLHQLPFIIGSRERYLKEYHMFPAMIRLIERVKQEYYNDSKPGLLRILPEKYFSEKKEKAKHNAIFSKTKKIVKTIFRKFIAD